MNTKQEVEKIVKGLLGLSNCGNMDKIKEKMIRIEIEKVFILGKMEGIKISVEGVKSLKIKDD